MRNKFSANSASLFRAPRRSGQLAGSSSVSSGLPFLALAKLQGHKIGLS